MSVFAKSEPTYCKCGEEMGCIDETTHAKYYMCNRCRSIKIDWFTAGGLPIAGPGSFYSVTESTNPILTASENIYNRVKALEKDMTDIRTKVHGSVLSTVANLDRRLKELEKDIKSEVIPVMEEAAKQLTELKSEKRKYQNISPIRMDVKDKVSDKKEVITSKPNRFEVGKYYQHNTGRVLHVLCKVMTTIYGYTMLAETPERIFVPVGSDTDAFCNWYEIAKDEWDMQLKIDESTRMGDTE